MNSSGSSGLWSRVSAVAMHSAHINHEAELLTVRIVGVLSGDDGSGVAHVCDVHVSGVSHHTHAGRAAEPYIDTAGVDLRVALLECLEQSSPNVLELGVGGKVVVCQVLLHLVFHKQG